MAQQATTERVSRVATERPVDDCLANAQRALTEISLDNWVIILIYHIYSLQVPINVFNCDVLITSTYETVLVSNSAIETNHHHQMTKSSITWWPEDVENIRVRWHQCTRHLPCRHCLASQSPRAELHQMKRTAAHMEPSFCKHTGGKDFRTAPSVKENQLDKHWFIWGIHKGWLLKKV